ncbi:MAG: hypothetical protein ACP5LW_01770 [Nitrososphaeria archaeon]
MKVFIDSSPEEDIVFRVEIKGDCIKSLGALMLIAEQTLFAMKNGELLARKPELDFLMRLAGTDQIFLAQERCGGKDNVIYVCASCETPKIEISAEDIEASEISALTAT